VTLLPLTIGQRELPSLDGSDEGPEEGVDDGRDETWLGKKILVTRRTNKSKTVDQLRRMVNNTNSTMSMLEKMSCCASHPPATKARRTTAQRRLKAIDVMAMIVEMLDVFVKCKIFKRVTIDSDCCQ
jgi:hypothetical protein